MPHDKNNKILSVGDEVDQLFDKLFELSEDDDSCGKINYAKDSCLGGVMYVTLDGKRFRVEVSEEK